MAQVDGGFERREHLEARPAHGDLRECAMQRHPPGRLIRPSGADGDIDPVEVGLEQLTIRGERLGTGHERPVRPQPRSVHRKRHVHATVIVRPDPERRSRRYYSITDAGREEYERLEREVRPFLESIQRSIDEIVNEVYGG